jgi:hypothetical protein
MESRVFCLLGLEMKRLRYDKLSDSLRLFSSVVSYVISLFPCAKDALLVGVGFPSILSGSIPHIHHFCDVGWLFIGLAAPCTASLCSFALHRLGLCLPASSDMASPDSKFNSEHCVVIVRRTPRRSASDCQRRVA